MNFDSIVKFAACLLPRRGSTKCGGPDARCADLEWAADHTDVCPGSPAITGLEVVPTAAQVEVGGKVPYTAALVFGRAAQDGHGKL